MRVKYRTTFLNDLKSLRDKRMRSVQAQLGAVRQAEVRCAKAAVFRAVTEDLACPRVFLQAIERVERAASLDEVPGVKRLHASGPYYRLRIGDYRLGFYVVGDVVTFVHALPRRDIYRHFP